MDMKVENWLGHEIRFIEKESEWWAIAADVAKALGYSLTGNMLRRLDEEEKANIRLPHIRVENGNKQDRRVSIISETGIYEAIFGSEKPEAKEFKKWVKDTLKQLRKASNLEGFQIFRMLDKEHQKETMSKMSRALNNPVRVDFMKANMIANKAISTRHGHPKALKKEQMTPQMLVDRQKAIEDTVTLMIAKDNFGIDLSVSEKIYSKYTH